jgi:hypothetical protein
MQKIMTQEQCDVLPIFEAAYIEMGEGLLK